MYYIRICKGLNDEGKLIPHDDDINSYVTDGKDYYRSVFFYNDEHYNHWKKTGSIAGITNVVGNKLVWDLDDVNDLEQARKDSVELCSRLIEYGIPQDDLQICFSGMKGFGIEVETDQLMTPAEFKNITQKLASDLKTFDTSVSNASRLIRLPFTKHNKTGLYKRPLSLSQLSEMPVEVIKENARTLDNMPEGLAWSQVKLSKSLTALKESKPENKKVVPTIQTNLDFTAKPKGFTNCKFAIMNGFFEEGQRSVCLSALAATCRAQNYPKEVTYNICKAAARMQANRTGEEAFPKQEIWNNIISQVYAPTWKGGQFSCKNDPTLKKVCDALGDHKCKDGDEKIFIELGDVSSKFANYAINIEKNTVKTGIDELDRNVQLTIGMTVGLLGAPSSGKTNVALNFLNNSSKANIPAIFFSMDMASHLVYLKLVQKHMGVSKNEVFEAYKHNTKLVAEWDEKLKNEYKNVKFTFKSGYNPEMMRRDILDYQEMIGEKVKIVCHDYLECIAGPYSDSTANTAIIANQLKDMGNELDICNLLLLQPQKHAGDPSEPLLSMRNVKGSSVIEQACSTILTIYREGFSATTPENDKFITISTVKDRMDSLKSLDFHWTGLTGTIRSLMPEERKELKQLKDDKKAKKAEEAASSPSGW